MDRPVGGSEGLEPSPELTKPAALFRGALYEIGDLLRSRSCPFAKLFGEGNELGGVLLL